MTKLENYNDTIFESIKHTDENGNEYWEARKLMVVLEYGRWRNFKKVIDKARLSCELSNNKVFHHFADVSKVLEVCNKLINVKINLTYKKEQCLFIVLFFLVKSPLHLFV